MAAPALGPQRADPAPRRLRSLLTPAGARAPLWTLNVAVIAAAATVFGVGARPLGRLEAPLEVHWYVLAPLFLVAELWVVHIRFQTEAHTFSLSEIPLVIGLFLASPLELVTGQVVGTGLALLYRRQPAIKLVFNLASGVLQSAIAVVLLHHVAGVTTGPRAWLAAEAAVIIPAAIGVLLVRVAVSLSESHWRLQEAPWGLALGLGGAAANTALGLEAVTVLRRDAPELLLLALPLAGLVVAYRAYAGERERHERMQRLYESSDILQRAHAGDSSVDSVLSYLCRVFRAGMAEITVFGARAGEAAFHTTTRRGERVDVDTHQDIGPLEEILLFVLPERRSVVVTAGETDPDLVQLLDSRGVSDAMATVLRVEDRVIGTMLVGGRLGTTGTFDDEDLKLFDTLAVQVSVSLENGRLERQLKHQAFHDSLTNLANRALFIDRVSHALTRRRHDTPASVAVLFVDLDDFKMVNDSLGHTGGDQLLCAVAERLRSCVRPFDTVARLGGDEFVVLLEDLDDTQDAVRIAERFVDVLRAPFSILGHEVAMHASIGIVSAEAMSGDAEELLRCADIAMYRAKEAGKGGYQLYRSGMQQAADQRLELKTDLEWAIDRGELVLQYQPILRLDDGRINGVEALVRWRHPQRGLVSPDAFIPLAEATGLIMGVGRFVLESACRQAVEWQRRHPAHAALGMSVNLSPRQLYQPDFVEEVARILEQTELPPNRLTLEITEGFMVEGLEGTWDRLRRIKDLGVHLSIDDFGTGYSSLSSLQHLPVDELKVAKPFVDDITEDSRKRAFALAIINLARTLGLRTVAEGVEHAEQRDSLQDLHCDMGQGFFFSRPVDPGQIDEMLRHDPGSGDRAARPGLVRFPGRRAV